MLWYRVGTSVEPWIAAWPRRAITPAPGRPMLPSIVGAAVARRVRRLVMPLQHALSVGEATVVLGNLGRGEEEDLGLDVRDLHLAVLHLGAEIPVRRKLHQ